MSPISINQVFRRIPSSLDLNGPVLSFTTQPVTTFGDSGGSVNLVGIATVSFPGNPSPENSGTITYQWYGPNGALTEGSKYSGTKTTTLTVSNLQTPGDSGENYYVEAAYTPSTETGNALNEPLKSNTATLNVYPTISITTQPQDATAAEDENATFTVVATISDTSFGGLVNQWYQNDVALSDRTNPLVSGSRTQTLTIEKINTDDTEIKFTGSITVNDRTITATSNTVDFIGVDPRNILNFEAYDVNNERFTSRQVNLDDVETFRLDDGTFGNDFGIIQFHSPEKPFDLRMNINAARGANNGSRNGGEGGSSVVLLSLKEDTEYTIIGIANNNGVFIYEGSTLLLVVGGGGDAGNAGNGGAGGGVDGNGTNGTGGIPGSAGLVPDNLSLTGIWGSIIRGADVDLYPGDSIANGSAAGRVITCSRGRYWVDEGVAPCSNNSSSNIRFRYADGTQETDSAEIIRGFKPGYTVTTTRGVGTTNGGNGGNGARGGEGGRNGGGGGGGSGYTNGTATVLRSTQGGNSLAESFIIFSVGPAYIDVRWSISREAGDSNRVTYRLAEGDGPNDITFGPNGGSFVTTVAEQSVYRLQSVSGSGPGSVGLRISGNTLQLDDRRGAGEDNDWNDLQVTPQYGRWNGTGEWRLDARLPD